MILPALATLYERLAADPAYDMPARGYSAQKISFRVVLRPDGGLFAIEDARDTVPAGKTGKKTKQVASQKLVPGNAKPSGQGINPCFLWDNTAYMLGYKTDDPKPERTAETFAAFRQKHLTLEKQIACPEFTAVCRFLESWTPARAREPAIQTRLDDFASTGFGVFQIQGQPACVHETPAIRAWWDNNQNNPADPTGATATDATPPQKGQCLVTGETSPLARLHEPAIKGVAGAQSSGAKIVSFNCDSFSSYTKDQSYNAPVSKLAAFRYANALNALLSGPQSARHRVQIADATCAFWTESKGAPFESLLADILGNTSMETTIETTQDEGLRSRLQTFLEILRSGGGRDIARIGADPDSRFYILALSPNASRLSIRYFHTDTLGHLVDNLKSHYEALRIARPPKTPEFPTVRQLTNAIAVMRKKSDGRPEPDYDTVPPIYSGPLMRAILEAHRYPDGLYQSILQRIHADAEITPLRAALIKATLNRNHKKQLTPMLDPTRTDTAYLLGRLFAALEKAQADAQPGINATVKDRFYSAASATPASVFPRILRTSQHHLAKLDMGARIYHEKRIQEIMSDLRDFPRQLSLEDQGLFAIGYYHQRQDFFTKKDDRQPQSPQPPENNAS